jgi:site-specific DNA-methyltransferase (adenine-specific)
MSRHEERIIGRAILWLGDNADLLPMLRGWDCVVTDPPYGMNKGAWDAEIPDWIPLVGPVPIAAFCGVIGMRDYPPAQWTGAWVRPASTQRIGALKGFNNWEPILFYNMPSLDNDVISCPNIHEDTGHPTTKPTPLMRRLVAKMPPGTVLDPFMGSGTTGIAAVEAGRQFIGIERDERYYEIACRRIEEAQRQGDFLVEAA